MSDSSRVQLAGIEESTWGTTPASALAAIRYTTESLGHRIENVRSDEVRADRQVTDIIPVGSNVDGGFDFELSYEAFDIYLQGAIGNEFSADVDFSDNGVSASDADNSFNGSGLPTVVPGQWIAVSGFANAANNGYFLVVSRTASKIVVTGGTLVTASAGPTIEIHASTVTNGVANKSFTLEKNFSDVTQFFSFTGCRINNLSLAIASRQKVTGTFGFLGQAGSLAAATVGTGAYTAAPTNTIMNASSNVGKILEGGAALGAGVFIQTLNIEYNNNLRIVDGVGQAAAVDIGTGRYTVTGDYTALFRSEVLFEKYLESQDSALAVQVEDFQGNAYVLSFPAIRYSDGDVVGAGNDNEVVASLTWEAKMHATEGVMSRIDKFDVA